MNSKFDPPFGWLLLGRMTQLGRSSQMEIGSVGAALER